MNFKQIIRFGNQTGIHKERIFSYVENLIISEKDEYECVIKPYKKSKTLEQLGYYWTAVISVARDWQGLTVEEADMFLKSNCCTPVYKEILGVTYEIRKSIAKMKVNEMAKYIDDCVNLLGSHGQYVPPPHYKE